MAKEKDQIQDDVEQTNDQTAASTGTIEIDEEQTVDTQKAREKAVASSNKFDDLISESDEVEDDDKEIPSAAKKPDKKTDEAAEEEEEEPSHTGDEKKSQEAETSKISAEMHKRAASLGMTPDEIAEYADDAELGKTVAIFEQIASEGDEEAEPAQRAQGQASEKADQKAEEKPFELKFKNEDEIDPEILAGMKTLHEQNADLRRQLTEQNARVDGLLGEIRGQRQKEVMSRFDKRITDLGEDYLGVFGKGNTLDMSRRTLARQNRDKVRKHMYALAKGMNDAGLDIPTEDRLFQMAVHNVFDDKVKAIDGARMSEKTKKRRSQVIGRPATAKTDKLTPRDRAIASSKDFDKKIDESEE